MIRLSQLLGQDAVALGTAARTGTVKGIGIDGSRIVNVQLSDMTIAATSVRSFEGYVLTYYETKSTAVPMDAASLDPRGTRALDMQGDEIGRIDDLLITEAGVIETIVLDNGTSLAGSRLRAIGTYAAILSIDLPPPTGLPLA